MPPLRGPRPAPFVDPAAWTALAWAVSCQAFHLGRSRITYESRSKTPSRPPLGLFGRLLTHCADADLFVAKLPEPLVEDGARQTDLDGPHVVLFPRGPARQALPGGPLRGLA